MSLILVVFVVVSVVAVYKFLTSRPAGNSPPGPIRLPVFGSYPQILLQNYNFPYKVLSKFSDSYKSPVISLYLGDIYCIVANSYDSCKELLNKPEFQGRPDTFPARARAYGKRLGIIFNDGDDWQHQKKFSLTELRAFGFGRRLDEYEAAVGEEIQDMIVEMREKSKAGGSVVVPDVLYTAMLNNTLQILLGRRVQGADRRHLQQFMEDTTTFFRSLDSCGGSLTFTPWIRHIIPEMSKLLSLAKSNDDMQNFATKVINDNKKDHEKGSSRGFIDVYTDNIDNHSYFSDDHLRMICTDVLMPANTASQALGFCMVNLASNPDVQERCQRQIDDVVGRGRAPTLNDKESLPMVEATLRESLRLHTVVPLGLPHASLEEGKLMGYDVPKGTLMFTNLYAMHHDKTVFQQPHQFMPDRFLDKDGKLDKKDMTLPFGVGRRVCSGEVFARQNLFLMLSTILQNFTIKPDSRIDSTFVQPGLVSNIRDNFKVKLFPRD